jgi:hypothetical protein
MGGTQLALAQAIIRRESASTYPSAREHRRAVTLTQAAVEERRRWHGPSAEALSHLLRMYIITGEVQDAVTAALPASMGGTARDHEAADPDVARHGALAAHVAGDAAALAFFLDSLPEDAQTRLVRAQTSDIDGMSQQELTAIWMRLVEETADDEMTAKCVSRLAFLGVWPPQADDLDRRSIMSPADIAVLKAVYLPRSGDRDRGLAKLRHLAHSDPSAAHALVLILEEDVSPDAAVEESERQVNVSQDPRLRMQLVGMLRAHGHHGRVTGPIDRIVRDVVADPVDIPVRAAQQPLYPSGATSPAYSAKVHPFLRPRSATNPPTYRRTRARGSALPNCAPTRSNSPLSSSCHDATSP